MNPEYDSLLKEKMDDASYKRLADLENKKLYDFVGKFVKHCNPATLYMADDSQESEDYVKKMSLEKGEEAKLTMKGQTIHYDGYNDQARDKVNTKFLIKKEQMERMQALNSVEYEEGLGEVMGFAENIMAGKDAVMKLFVEGPAFSDFARPCVQMTDSWYVLHSEQILYRSGYEHFKQMADKDDFYRFIHSAGEQDERGCTVNLDKRRIYMDTENLIVYSMNDQYAGNSLGLKKHSMRLAIKQSGEQGWLCEHMFVMACVDEEKSRKTYFAGAYPSACGKTSTAMIPGEQIVGDDIAYFKQIDNEFRAVNVEQGIFGIIKDVNTDDDPVIFDTLKSEKEIIFSNILTGPDNKPYWLGMGEEAPKTGSNFSGPNWEEGKKDAKGNEIKLAHANARYTIKLEYLDNFDKEGYDKKDGVKLDGVIYGGRDSDTCVPVEESFSWEEGILLKAVTLESETTAATLGKEGVKTPSPMANLDFLSYPFGEYVENNLDFVKGMKEIPKVFSTNYFLLKDGKFCNEKITKKVWLHWADARVHGEVDGYKTPTGIIPKYEDLVPLFKKYVKQDFTLDDYNYQFTFRCSSWIGKLERSIAFSKKLDPNVSSRVTGKLEEYIKIITDAKAKFGDEILPGKFEA